jgi:hypothetical protein
MGLAEMPSRMLICGNQAVREKRFLCRMIELNTE